ncbi:MAG: hypothetical protein CMD43_05795 [Gammaproteobacteria bacterium]|nr:hypothetical protein [Gammaproteobacteria bacterium]
MKSKKKKINIAYSFVIADLFHYGHLRLLQTAKNNYDYHICGVLTDEICKKWQGQNLCTLDERLSVIKSSKYVDEVMIQDSLNPQENLVKLIKKYKDCKITVLHGNDWKLLPGKIFMEKNNINIKLVNYYSRLSREALYNFFTNDKDKNFTHNLDYQVVDSKKLTDTKGQTLNNLNNLLKESYIEPLYTFTGEEFINNKSHLIKTIKKYFKSNIIIRSSTSLEDSDYKSHAGQFLSIQNVDIKNNKVIEESIIRVMDSYKKIIKSYLKEEILIQKQSNNIITSGVIFTRNLETNEPYYVISYDDHSGKTDTVTSGMSSQTIWLHRNTSQYRCPKKWSKLLASILEIENLFKNMILDIEFAITKQKDVVIYQVRPLAANSKYFKNSTLNDNHINKIAHNYKEYSGMNNFVLSDMAFWNPSELIGDNPKPLSYTLFDNLITEDSWNKGIYKLGYTNIEKNLMYKCGNKPYINVDYAINALLPNSLSKLEKNQIAKYYKKKFLNNRTSHDKFEFDIMDTYNLLDDYSIENIENYVNKTTLNRYKKALKKITLSMIENYALIKKECIRDVKKCVSQSKNITDACHVTIINSIINDISLLRKYATPQFSIAARMAFVAKSIIENMYVKNVFSDDDLSNLYKSLNTVAVEYQYDLSILSKTNFIKKYGHLRSGTYSLNALKISQLSNILSKNIKHKKPNKINNKKYIKKINDYIKNSKTKLQADDIFKFLTNSLVLRESLKFEFTKVVSKILDKIDILANLLNIKKELFEYLPITVIKAGVTFEDITQLRMFYNKHISLEKEIFKKNSNLIQNQIIINKNSFYIIENFISKPNYVTKKVIKSKIHVLNDLNNNKLNLNNKIVVISQADPGFDWIFSYKIKGLITKYGGIGSHMAIRCAEFDLPAAIGCGKELYDNLVDIDSITLDCNNKKIILHEGNEILN